MPVGRAVARFGAIAERDARGLVVKLQDVRVAFHPENRTKLHAIAFKLDGHAHLGARIVSGDVKSTPARSAHRRRSANGGDERFGFSARAFGAGSRPGRLRVSCA